MIETTDFEDSALLSAFQRRVYAACCRIPRGRVATYAALAASIDCASPRAVGQALKRNPFAPDVPCHRVVASDLSLGGFMGRRDGPEVLRKKRLLLEEGVGVDPQGRIVPEYLWSFKGDE